MEPVIAYLVDHPEYVPTLAEWHHYQFLHLSPGSTIERCASHLRSQPGGRQIPTTLVALTDGELLGSASLVAQDMSIHPEFSPWLASVYVAPQFRNQGIGSTLVQRIVEEARALDVQRLHLYTPDKEHFYLRLGWYTLEHVDYRNSHVAVMAFDLGEPVPPERADVAAEMGETQ